MPLNRPLINTHILRQELQRHRERVEQRFPFAVQVAKDEGALRDQYIIPIPDTNGTSYRLDPHFANRLYIELVAGARVVGVVLTRNFDFYSQQFIGKLQVDFRRMPYEATHIPNELVLSPYVTDFDDNPFVCVGPLNLVQQIYQTGQQGCDNMLHFASLLSKTHEHDETIDWDYLLSSESTVEEFMAIMRFLRERSRPTAVESILQHPQIASDHSHPLSKKGVNLADLVEFVDPEAGFNERNDSPGSSHSLPPFSSNPEVPSISVNPESYTDDELPTQFDQMTIDNSQNTPPPSPPSSSFPSLPSTLMEAIAQASSYGPRVPQLPLPPIPPIAPPSILEITVVSPSGYPPDHLHGDTVTEREVTEVETLFVMLTQRIPRVYNEGNEAVRHRILN